MDYRDEEIRRLKDQLYDARSTILDLVDDEFSEMLNDIRSVGSLEEVGSFLEGVSLKVIERAVILPKGHDQDWTDRAYCPLCGAGSQGHYVEGFVVPKGLSLHLTGRGRTDRCIVIKVCKDLALDYFRRQEK
ncbi:MAG: hypothetical protein WBB23_07100 [Desulforhopalus sp.]